MPSPSHLEEMHADKEKHADTMALENAVREATAAEHELTFVQAIKLYPKAVAWSVLLSTAIVMEGYDTLLLPTFFASPEFQKKYGAVQPNGSHVISAAWRSGLTNGASVGEIIGLQLTGVVQDRYGYRKTILGALLGVTGFIFVVFFAQNLQTLLAGEILCGVCWGVFQTLTTAYASEVCPVALRAYLTTYVNLCWVIGQLIGAGVQRGMLGVHSQWSYHIPFAIQWAWPVPLIIGCFLAPESPWWHVRQGNIDAAKHSLRRLISNDHADSQVNIDNLIAMMLQTNELECEETVGTRYRDCFKKVNLRRTEIVCIVWLIQHFCGSTFMGYSTNFYESAGLATADSFDMTIVQYALGFMGTVGSWFVIARAGRRTIYLTGLCVLCMLQFTIGFASLARADPSRDWGIGTMLLLFTFVYDFTVGPLTYSLVSELSSTRLRAKSIVLARNVYNVGGIVVNILSNYQLTSTAWNWGAKTGFFWAGSGLICISWAFFRLPEPSGRTYGELDVLFERRVPARKFKTATVDVIQGTAEVQ